jgi:hypothetical protein
MSDNTANVPMLDMATAAYARDVLIWQGTHAIEATAAMIDDAIREEAGMLLPVFTQSLTYTIGFNAARIYLTDTKSSAMFVIFLSFILMLGLMGVYTLRKKVASATGMTDPVYRAALSWVSSFNLLVMQGLTGAVGVTILGLMPHADVSLPSLLLYIGLVFTMCWLVAYATMKA